jgi:hypothetical protein
MSEGAGAYTPEGLMAAIKLISRCLDDASLDCLERTHALLEAHFFSVAEPPTFENAAEQRILGMLWAEVEIAVDARKKQL